jgi:molybdopterin biosynthesis enzyme
MVDPQPQRIARLTPLADALASIDRLVAPVEPRRIKLVDAAGMCLAADIVVRHAHPGSVIALRDGIAIGADATLDASSYAPARLAGAPTFVDVGDRLPPNTDAVAPLDGVEIREGSVDVLMPFAPGDGVLPPEADAAAGDVPGRAGTRLRESDVTVLSVLGVSDVEVREPRVCVAVANPGRDAIIGAIEGLLLRAVEAAGASVVMSSASRLGVEDAIAAADAVIVIGGSGSGRRDHSVRDLARLGTVAFHGVGLAPGETAAFGVAEQRPVLIMPGRLDAALAVWLTLGRRMLARLSGYEDEGQGTPVTLTRKIASTLGLAELVPVAREQGGVAPLASGYLALRSLARADGYVLVPADSEGFPAGARVEMRPLP